VYEKRFPTFAALAPADTEVQAVRAEYELQQGHRAAALALRDRARPYEPPLPSP